jgi:hypothetical protein
MRTGLRQTKHGINGVEHAGRSGGLGAFRSWLPRDALNDISGTGWSFILFRYIIPSDWLRSKFGGMNGVCTVGFSFCLCTPVYWRVLVLNLDTLNWRQTAWVRSLKPETAKKAHANFG